MNLQGEMLLKIKQQYVRFKFWLKQIPKHNHSDDIFMVNALGIKISYFSEHLHSRLFSPLFLHEIVDVDR